MALHHKIVVLSCIPPLVQVALIIRGYNLSPFKSNSRAKSITCLSSSNCCREHLVSSLLVLVWRRYDLAFVFHDTRVKTCCVLAILMFPRSPTIAYFYWRRLIIHTIIHTVYFNFSSIKVTLKNRVFDVFLGWFLSRNFLIW